MIMGGSDNARASECQMAIARRIAFAKRALLG